MRRLTPVATKQFSVLLGTSLLVIIFGLLNPNFLTARNFLTIIRNIPELGFLSIGMAIVMITGGIDVSAETILGIVAITIGKLMLSQLFSPILAPFIGLLSGTLLGLLNGLLVAYGRVIPIIATLGALYLWRAVIFLLVGARWLTGVPRIFDPVTKGTFIGIPIPFFVFLAISLGLEWILRFTPLGWRLRAVGDNEYSARLAGVNTRRLLVLSYTSLGFLCGLAGFFYIGKYRNVEMTVASGMSLEAIAAAIIGGTSILGGEGTILGCLLGVFFVRLLQNGLVLLHIPSLWDYLFLGGLIIFVSALDLLTKRRKT